MSQKLKDLEAILKKIKTDERELDAKVFDYCTHLESLGASIPKSLSEIPDFPYENFIHFKNSLGKYHHMQRFSTKRNLNLFNLLCSPNEKNINSALLIAIFIIPVLAICLAIFVSSWFILLLICVPLILKKTSKLYDKIILRSAYRSERAFLLLFFLKQICLTCLDYKDCFYWEDEVE